MKFQVINRHSVFHGMILDITEQEWNSGSFWIPVMVEDRYCIVARSNVKVIE